MRKVKTVIKYSIEKYRKTVIKYSIEKSTKIKYSRLTR